MPQIIVQNRQRVVSVQLPRLQEFATRALACCLAVPAPGSSELARLIEVGVVVISDARIAQLHRRFMNIEGPTDVITFQHGEIFISAETAGTQARLLGISPQREIELYLVHGLLHLHGFDDTSPRTAEEMLQVQTRLITQLREAD